MEFVQADMNKPIFSMTLAMAIFLFVTGCRTPAASTPALEKKSDNASSDTSCAILRRDENGNVVSRVCEKNLSDEENEKLVEEYYRRNPSRAPKLRPDRPMLY